MKTPKMPKPIASVKPTSPEIGTSGMIEATEKQKKKQGLFSTLLGQGGPTGNKLQQYLASSNYTTNTNLPSNFFNRTKPGGATVAS